jgi:phytoene dehydrogenase-like protein
MGPQYVWEFGDGMIGDRFLRFLGVKASNPFVPMAADGFERLFIGRKSARGDYFRLDFKVPQGLENFRRDLIALFPDEADNLNPLFDDIIAIFDTYKAFFKKHSATEGRFLLATKFLLAGNVPMSIKLKIGRAFYQPLKEFFDQHQVPPIIRRILYGHGGIFAENESEMSTIAYIVGTGNYHAGAWYPQNGFYHFFDSLASVIRVAGGSVETGKKVIRVETKDNLAVRAICEDGSSYACDFLFSDISPRLTYSLLGLQTESFDYTPSHSIPACCIGVKGGLASIADMKGRNYWWQDGKEVNYHSPDILSPPQMLFINSPTANGFGRTADTDHDALVVFCPGNYDQEQGICRRGPDAVNRFKRKLAGHIVDILEENIFPGIRERLLFADIISSLDIERDTGGEFGNAYGRRLTVEELLKGPIKEQDCPANLYNVSATKNSPGIAAGIFTASLIFEELTGQKI